MALQKYDDAIFAYKKALEYEPNDAESGFNLGNAYFFKHAYDDAIRVYQALTVKGNDPRVWYNMGETYFMAGKEEKALECYNHIQSHKQQFPPMLLRMAACYQKLGRFPQAEALLAELAAMPAVPDDVKNMGRGLLAQMHKKGASATAKA